MDTKFINQKIIGVIVISYFVVFAYSEVTKCEGSKCHKLPASPGCNKRPICANVTGEGPCDESTNFVDRCWCQVYYECDNGTAVPFICPEPLIANPEVANGSPGSLVCEWPELTTCDTSDCGCDPSCEIPPICPEIETNITKGLNDPDCAPLFPALPHPCDCQFYWSCDNNRVPHLQRCGPRKYFQPSGENGGECVAIYSDEIPENVACLNEYKALDASSRTTTVPPTTTTQRAVKNIPIIDLLISRGLPVPEYLRKIQQLQQKF